MLKGINKQIIEIKCTNDELFEKALLFVRSDKADLPQAVFTEHSEEIFLGTRPDTAGKKRPRVTAALTALLISAVCLLAACIYFYSQAAQGIVLQ